VLAILGIVDVADPVAVAAQVAAEVAVGLLRGGRKAERGSQGKGEAKGTGGADEHGMVLFERRRAPGVRNPGTQGQSQRGAFQRCPVDMSRVAKREAMSGAQL
jgi:hypothetical protein